MKTAVVLPLRLRLRLRLRAPCAGLSSISSPSPTPTLPTARRFPLAPVSRFSVVRSYASAPSATAPAASVPPPASFLRRALVFVALGLSFGSLGFAMTIAPAVPGLNGILSPPTDAETLALFTPDDAQAMQIEEHLQNHWVTRELRAQPETTESRPHLKIPETFRSQNLTAGTLLGPGKVAVPPLVFTEAGGKSLVSLSYLGTDLCGHPDIVHGGFLATMLDEGLARCSFGALPHGVGMTANLNVNYRAPTPAGTYVVLRARTTKAEGRKAWVEGRIETLVAEGETPVVLADATGLFISPKQAAAMATVMPVQ